MTAKSHNIDEVHERSILVPSREIFLCGEEGYTDEKMAVTFLKNLRFLENKSSDPIVIHQFNHGGSFSAGMLIFDAIHNSKCKIAILCYGSACSMGSLIPQAADLRITYEHCTWLIHEGSTDLSGSHKHVTSNIEYEKRQLEEMYSLYYNKISLSEKFKNKTQPQIMRFLKSKLDSKEDWLLDGYQAVEYGFADAVYGLGKYASVEEIKKNVR